MSDTYDTLQRRRAVRAALVDGHVELYQTSPEFYAAIHRISESVITLTDLYVKLSRSVDESRAAALEAETNAIIFGTRHREG